MSLPAVSPSIRTATGMLILITLLWGVSFPLVKNWQIAAASCPGGKLLATSSLIAVRMIAALVVLAVIRPRLFLAPRRREHVAGLILGTTFFLGFTLQVLGLAWTTPARSAFVTSLSSAWVPLVARVWFGIRVPAVTWLGLMLAIAGTAILGMTGAPAVASSPPPLDAGRGPAAFGWGDGLTLVSSVVFAVQILMLDRVGRTVDSAHITVAFLGITGSLGLALALVDAAQGPGIGAWIGWLRGMLEDWTVLRDLALMVLLSTVLAFHWMNVFQPRVSASRAALIYLLEPVFGSVFSVCLGHDPLTAALLFGGGLILGGNALAELPQWARGPEQASNA